MQCVICGKETFGGLEVEFDDGRVVVVCSLDCMMDAVEVLKNSNTGDN